MILRAGGGGGGAAAAAPEPHYSGHGPLVPARRASVPRIRRGGSAITAYRVASYHRSHFTQSLCNIIYYRIASSLAFALSLCGILSLCGVLPPSRRGRRRRSGRRRGGRRRRGGPTAENRLLSLALYYTDIRIYRTARRAFIYIYIYIYIYY